jgi:hypothetical protein
MATVVVVVVVVVVAVVVVVVAVVVVVVVVIVVVKAYRGRYSSLFCQSLVRMVAGTSENIPRL